MCMRRGGWASSSGGTPRDEEPRRRPDRERAISRSSRSASLSLAGGGRSPERVSGGLAAPLPHRGKVVGRSGHVGFFA